MSRGKNWCFTLNNPTNEETKQIESALGNGATYIIFGREVGESGTPHLQGYVELSQRRRRGAVRELLGKRVHLEIRRGTQEQAVEYCRKDGDYEEMGEAIVSQQGKRSDLDVIKEKIKNGVTEKDIADEHFTKWVVYRKSFAAYRQLNAADEIRTNLRVVFLYGAAGCGKTRLAYETYRNLYRVPDHTLKWFDGYRQEETVLLDDYRGSGDDGFLLQLLDIYPMQVPVKGGFEPWTPKLIIITSNMTFPFGHDSIEAPLGRRIHKRYSFLGPLDFSDERKISELQEKLFH